jgi:hypothetical protein
VIVWHLLADPTARYHDLGAGYYTSRIDKHNKARNHIRQLEAWGSPSPWPPQPDPPPTTTSRSIGAGFAGCCRPPNPGIGYFPVSEQLGRGHATA